MDLKVNLFNLNDKQYDAGISLDKRLLVLAGAESGKTKSLIQKLIYLTDEGAKSPTNILAITFTKNATNEMIDRLIISADEEGTYESLLKDKSKNQVEKNELRQAYVRKYKWIENFTIRKLSNQQFGGNREAVGRFRILINFIRPLLFKNKQLIHQFCFFTAILFLIKKSFFFLNLDKSEPNHETFECSDIITADKLTLGCPETIFEKKHHARQSCFISFSIKFNWPWSIAEFIKSI